MNKFSSGIFQHPTDVNSDYFEIVSGKRHSCARFLCRSGTADSVIISAGTCDDSRNSVGVWSLRHVLDCQQNEKLLSDYESYKVDSSVTCVEFWEGNPVSNLYPLWAGLADGSVLLLGNKEEKEGYVQYSLIQNVGMGSSSGPLHSAAVSAIAVHSSGTKCITVGEDGNMYELSVQGSGSVSVSPWPEVLDWMAVYDVKYGPDGRSFFSAGGSGQIKMWDQRCLNRPKVFGGMEGGGNFYSIEPFDRAGVVGIGARDELLIAGGEDGRISIFDVRQVKKWLSSIGNI